jgi:hypothetical protein
MVIYRHRNISVTCIKVGFIAEGRMAITDGRLDQVPLWLPGAQASSDDSG